MLSSIYCGAMNVPRDAAAAANVRRHRFAPLVGRRSVLGKIADQVRLDRLAT